MREDPERCKICGETFTATDRQNGNYAEMYDPDASQAIIEMGVADGIVHAECGLQRGWEVA
jgi:hypothetical protein